MLDESFEILLLCDQFFLSHMYRSTNLKKKKQQFWILIWKMIMTLSQIK